MRIIFVFFLMTSATILHAQENKLPETQEAFKEEVLRLRSDVDNIQKNLHLSHNRFKVGIASASLGYTVTIIGGLMLGRKNDELGKALLYTGGAIGLTGTILLVDAYKYVGRAGKPTKRKEK